MAEQTITELRIVMLDFKERVPIFIEMNKLEAKVKYEKYLALVAEGFTPDQALMLCK